MARAWRNHPFVYVPPSTRASAAAACSSPSSSRAASSRQVKQLDDAQRDRFGEIVFRFFFGTLKHTRRAAGDPHPGNYLLLDDGRVGFLDFGLMRVVDADYLARRARPRARRHAPATRRAGPRAAWPRSATSPTRRVRARAPARPDPGRRRLVPRARLPPPHLRLRDRDDRAAAPRPRSPYFEQMRRETIPPQALLIRRMEGLVFAVLGDAPRRRRLARARRGVLGGRAAEHRRSASRTQAFWGTRLAASRVVAPCSPPPSPPSPCSPACSPAPSPTSSDQTPLPILLPSTLDTDVDPLYASGEGHKKDYQIAVSPARDCGGANACSLAYFSAYKGVQALRHAQGHAGQRPPAALPAAELRRLVLAAVGQLEGARRDLRDPDERAASRRAAPSW